MVKEKVILLPHRVAVVLKEAELTSNQFLLSFIDYKREKLVFTVVGREHLRELIEAIAEVAGFELKLTTQKEAE